MTRSHLPLKWMGNFKAVAIDYEFYLTLSDKPVSVCLSERQMYVLSVQNTYTAWLTRWYNTDDITQSVVASIAAEIEALLMCGCGVPVISFTDRMSSITYVSNTSTGYETVYNTWNTGGQTVVSIAPDLDFATGTPADIEKLTCLAVSMLIQAIIEAAKATKQGDLQQAQDLTRGLTGVFGALSTAGGAAIAVGGSAAALVSFIGGPWLLLGLALAGVGTGIASLVMTTDDAALNDAEAIKEIECTIQNNTGGANLTLAAFSGALTPNGFTPGSNAEKLSSVIQAYLSDQTTYLQFLTAAQGLYGASDVGALPDCEDCTLDPVWRIITPAGYPGGVKTSQVDNGDGTWTTVFTAQQGSDTVWRVSPFLQASECFRWLSLTWSVAPTFGYTSHFPCGSTNTGNDYTTGAIAGVPITPVCIGGLNTGKLGGAVFTVTIVTEGC